jgi:hypothetical protein
MAASTVEAGADGDALRPSWRGSALPQLSGRWLTAARIFWWPLFALTLAATVAGLHYDRVNYEQRVQPFSDLGLRSGGGSALSQPLGRESRAAGIRAGRRIVAVEGRPLPSDAPRELLATRLREASGPVVGITTRGPNGDVRQHRLRRGPHHLDDAYRGVVIGSNGLLSIESGLGFAANLIAIFAALLLFRRRPRDPVAALLSFAFLGVTAGSGQAWATLLELGLPTIADTLRIAGFGALFVGVLIFPGGRFEPRWTLWAALVAALWVVVGIALALLTQLTSWTAYNLLGIALMVSSVAAMALRYRRVGSGIERQQIRWAAFGFAAGGLLGSAAGVIAEVQPSIDDQLLYAWLRLLNAIISPTAWALLALGLLVSLLRYRLYDADAAISRSAGYAVLTLLLGATFAATAKGMEVFFETSFGREAGAWPGAIGAGLAVVLITPLHNRIHGWAERRFQKALLHLKRDLPDCVGDLRETAGMQELLDEVLARVEAGTRAVRSAVVIDGRTVATRGEGGEDFPVVMPLRIDHQETEIGTLLVGPRPDGSPPGKDEREALDEIADPVARAVRIVRLRESREAEERTWRRTLETRLAALEGGE